MRVSSCSVKPCIVGASMPAQNTRGERAPGKNPTLWTAIVNGFHVQARQCCVDI